MSMNNQAMSDLLKYNAAILPRTRSSFDKSHSYTTTFDSSYLVPIMYDRVLPGDEKKIRVSALARMMTPLHPTMDTANLDIWAFYVPDRLWWSHAREFYGENKDASFNPDGEYVMPFLKPSQYMVSDATTGGVDRGVMSLNDYFGMPKDVNVNANFSTIMDNDPEFFVTAGLHRSYQLIWNDWFRNSSIQPALQLNTGDNVTDSEWEVIRKIRKVNKLPDFYTSLLREPQSGDDVTLPLGEYAPVVPLAENVVRKGSESIRFSGDFSGTPSSRQMLVLNMSSNFDGNPVSASSTVLNAMSFDQTVTGNYIATDLYPSNLWADLTNATAATINNLRAAITVQQLLEIDAVSGKRYQQILQGHFGVFVPDATLQRPELLGASRTPVGIRQVLQTSQSTNDSALGDTAAFSMTSVDNEWICNKAFVEPGFIMVLAAVRPLHSYSQGLDPLLTKLQRYDHYWPVFDHLGNQPLYQKNIVFGDAGNVSNYFDPEHYKQVFGYMPAWTEYKVKQNLVTGLMRPNVEGTLSSWNYTSYLDANVTLNSAFIEEDENLIERTIAVQNEPQFLLDVYFDYIDIKSMSVHSIPGLTRL